MQELFDQAFTMPTTVWSVLLIAVIAYWGLKLLTGLDFVEDLFGGAEGAIEGGIEPGLEVDLDADLDADGSSGHGRGWVRLLGFGEVPVILVLSLIVGFGWIASFTGSRLFTGLTWFTAGSAGAIALIALVSLAVSLALTVLAVTPLRRLMHFTPATELRQLVGRTARVTTLRVDGRFGQAEVEDDVGAPILIQARSDVPNEFTRGDLVALASYDPEREAFVVVESVDVESPLGRGAEAARAH